MLANITAREYMTAKPVAFRPDTDVFEAIRKLLEHRITGAPVLDEQGKIVGAFSELDCLRVTLNCTYFEEQAGRVSEFMTKDVTSIDAETSILEVAEMFTKSPLRHFPVTENGKLVGVISRVDILKALISIK